MFEPTKRCTKCGERKYLYDFKGSQCGDCHAEYHRAWKQSDHGKSVIRQCNQRAQRDKRAMCLLAAAKRRAKQKGVPFYVSAEERARLQAVIDGGVCELTGLPFKMDNANALFCWDSPSIDRIRPALGYTDGNMRVVVYGMNAAIGAWGEDVLETMVRSWLDRKDRTC